MSEEQVTIVEYSEDIADQDAPPPLPKGEYEGVIQSAKVLEGQASGKKYYATTFHITSEQFPADYPADIYPDGLLITYRRVSAEDVPRSRYQARTFCETIGAKTGRVIDCSDWLNLSAKVYIDHSEYNGVDREEITRVSSL